MKWSILGLSLFPGRLWCLLWEQNVTMLPNKSANKIQRKIMLNNNISLFIIFQRRSQWLGDYWKHCNEYERIKLSILCDLQGLALMCTWLDLSTRTSWTYQQTSLILSLKIKPSTSMYYSRFVQYLLYLQSHPIDIDLQAYTLAFYHYICLRFSTHPKHLMAFSIKF